MIRVENLTKFFGPVQAVDHISFSVDRGEIVGFLGPNGAGKTTTMRILTTYLPASEGSANVAGFDVMNESMQVRRNIGYLPESVPLYPEMRVEEYLLYRARLKNVDRSVRQSRIDYVLERCRIREVRRRLLSTLSKGYRQRVGLADALVHDPAILILDEPTSGLDPLQIRETLNLIRHLGEKHTILLSTHILSEVEAVCRRVIIISSGRIGLDKKMNELGSEGNLITVEARGPLEQILNALRTTTGVTQVTGRSIDNGVVACEIRSKDSQDLREQIAQRITANGWALRQLDMRRRKLEDHFMEVVMRNEPVARFGGENIAQHEPVGMNS
ncbi:ABC transporter ATP-binding protein [soil metagenome]